MSSYVKFDNFVLDIANGAHNLSSDTLKVMLTNTAPTASTAHYYSDISGTEVANGNGYTTGGATATTSSSSQTGGTYKLVLADVTWTPSGGSVGPWRYAVLYNNTASLKNLIGYWDRGSSTTTSPPDTITVDFDATNGVLTLA